MEIDRNYHQKRCFFWGLWSLFVVIYWLCNVCKTFFFFYKTENVFYCIVLVFHYYKKNRRLDITKDDENMNSLPFMCWIDYLLFCAETNIYFLNTHIYIFYLLTFLFCFTKYQKISKMFLPKQIDWDAHTDCIDLYLLEMEKDKYKYYNNVYIRVYFWTLKFGVDFVDTRFFCFLSLAFKGWHTVLPVSFIDFVILATCDDMCALWH